MRPLLLLAALLFSLQVFGQDTAWQMKFVVHLQTVDSIYTDTVWFGVHQDGGEGYQPGLDSLDLSEMPLPLSIRSGDPLIGECNNLRRNIKNPIQALYNLIFSYALTSRVMSVYG